MFVSVKKDYFKAADIWNVFKMNTMGDYHDLYLKTDVLLLADVFEKFISLGFDYYGLDSCQLDLISDADMHLFIEKGMRGGNSYIAKRHSKTNNKYMESYDCSKEINTSLILMQIIYMVGQ